MDSHHDSLLEISESDRYTNMLLSNNLTDIFQNDYYSKFKNSQNILEPSMTMSRVSQIEKNSDECSNVTHIRMVHTSERLAQMLTKNQLLETQTQVQARTIIELSNQLDALRIQLQESNRQNDKLSKLLLEEQNANKKQKNHIKELQFIVKSSLVLGKQRVETLQTSIESLRPNSQPKRGQNHSYSSSRACFTKILTEETKQYEHKKNTKYYRSQSNFWSSVNASPIPAKLNQTNVSASKSNKIENTLSLLKAIKLQCTQFSSKKHQ